MPDTPQRLAQYRPLVKASVKRMLIYRFDGSGAVSYVLEESKLVPLFAALLRVTTGNGMCVHNTPRPLG